MSRGWHVTTAAQAGARVAPDADGKLHARVLAGDEKTAALAAVSIWGITASAVVELHVLAECPKRGCGL